jgi:RNA polymerase sigma-70 factor (ECF subfamily)
MTPKLDIEKLKAGDQEELKQLFDWLVPQLHSVVRRYAGRVDADDIAQEAILKIYTNLVKFKGGDPAHFLRWCQAIARNISIDRMRMCRAKEEPMALYELPSEDHFASAHAEEMGKEVRHALSKLTAEEQILIELRYLENLSYSEIANRLEVSPATLRSRLYRAIQKLREILKAEQLLD